MLDRLLQPDVQQYIRENEQADIGQLLLKGKSVSGVSAKDLVTQIIGRSKAKLKLPEWYRSDNVIYPFKLSMEQCSSEQTSKYKATIVKGKKMIDLTGGAGIDTYAFSKKYPVTSYVEQNADLFAVTSHNFLALSATNIVTFYTTAENFLRENSSDFDLIYLDPARRSEAQKKVFRFEDCSPNIISLIPTLLKRTKYVMIKTAPFLDITQALRELNHVREIHVVAVNNECKEVLYLLSNETPQNHQLFAHTVNINEGKPSQIFKFNYKNESEVMPNFSLPSNFIYEPNTAILKSGGINSVGVEYNLAKLHPNSQLFTSDEVMVGFPGRIFESIEVLKYDKKAIRKAISSGKANITTRNFPQSVAQIRKLTGLKDGGEDYLFATTNMNNEKIILRTKKLDNPMG